MPVYTQIALGMFVAAWVGVTKRMNQNKIG